MTVQIASEIASTIIAQYSSKIQQQQKKRKKIPAPVEIH